MTGTLSGKWQIHRKSAHYRRLSDSALLCLRRRIDRSLALRAIKHRKDAQRLDFALRTGLS